MTVAGRCGLLAAIVLLAAGAGARHRRLGDRAMRRLWARRSIGKPRLPNTRASHKRLLVEIGDAEDVARRPRQQPLVVVTAPVDSGPAVALLLVGVVLAVARAELAREQREIQALAADLGEGRPRRAAGRAGAHFGDDLVRVQVIQPPQGDVLLEVRVDALVRDLVRRALHVRLEGVAIAPPADHHDVAGVTIGLPHLQIDEAVGLVAGVRAAAERRDELGRALRRDLQSRHRHVHHVPAAIEIEENGPAASAMQSRPAPLAS